MRNRVTNHEPARKSRVMVLSLTLGVAFLALWVFGSNFVLKVARMMDEPVTKHVAMEVVVPVAIPESPREAPYSAMAQTDWPDEPAVAESAGAETGGSNTIAWEPFAPKPAEASIALNQPASSAPSTPAPVAPDQATSVQTPDQAPSVQRTPTPSKAAVAKGQVARTPSESAETAPAALEPLVPKPVRTTVAEAQTAPPPVAPVVVASAESSIESRWPGRLVARAVEPVADTHSGQSSIPLPPIRPHVAFVPLPAPRPAIGTRQRSVAGRVLTETDIRMQEMHF